MFNCVSGLTTLIIARCYSHLRKLRLQLSAKWNGLISNNRSQDDECATSPQLQCGKATLKHPRETESLALFHTLIECIGETKR